MTVLWLPIRYLSLKKNELKITSDIGFFNNVNTLDLALSKPLFS